MCKVHFKLRWYKGTNIFHYCIALLRMSVCAHVRACCYCAPSISYWEYLYSRKNFKSVSLEIGQLNSVEAMIHMDTRITQTQAMLDIGHDVVKICRHWFIDCVSNSIMYFYLSPNYCTHHHLRYACFTWLSR